MTRFAPTAVLAACGTVLLAGALATPAMAETARASSPASSTLAVAKLTQSQAEARLRAAGISWTSSGHCTNRNHSNCTSFEQINVSTVNGIITFKRASGCSITITGGTETGHASGSKSHWNGYKVDVNPTACVTDYIKRNFKYIGQRGDGAAQYQSSAGNIYARESTHWDITYQA
ncbi:hypothetical protein FHS39_004588 [Streptomyces olivoverticillatus]|uniref:Uncharacterized protein n=2 Tax=Streptomyces olivoverticillatus TaxID=66427 RepID=A0A7W7LSA4_9ACTN|nr:hypothetical protein [Streptomyces olivoverticillatus]